MAQNSSAECGAAPSLSGVCTDGKSRTVASEPGLLVRPLHSAAKVIFHPQVTPAPERTFPGILEASIHLAPGPERSRILWTVLFLAAHSS